MVFSICSERQTESASGGEWTVGHFGVWHNTIQTRMSLSIQKPLCQGEGHWVGVWSSMCQGPSVISQWHYLRQHTFGPFFPRLAFFHCLKYMCTQVPRQLFRNKASIYNPLASAATHSVHPAASSLAWDLVSLIKQFATSEYRFRAFSAFSRKNRLHLCTPKMLRPLCNLVTAAIPGLFQLCLP